MKSEVNVFPSPDLSGKTVAVVEVREGQALPLKEPNVIIISGDIETVANFLGKRYSEHANRNEDGECNMVMATNYGLQVVDPSRSIVIVDVENGTIELMLDPENHYGPKIKGQLLPAKELDIFRINTTTTYTREQLIKIIRFNRALFLNKDKQSELLAAFQKFSAKVFVDLEKEDDSRGNASAIFKRTVNSNIPLNFVLEMPIYKGQPAEKFDVEICIESNGSAVAFYFESTELAELLEQRKKEIIQKQLESCLAFPVIYK